MVLLAFVLFTVSTLATQTKALQTDQPAVRHECGNKTLCHIKPADYPQEEIDRAVLKQLPYLRRMKREISKPIETESGQNCKVEKKEFLPFKIVPNNEQHLPKFVVQSKWFSQHITEVKCVQQSPSPPCFSYYLLPGKTTQCKPKTTFISLLVYDIVKKRVIEERTKIGIDCVCAITDNYDEISYY